MAGHTGYGLGLLAELLSGVLPGGAITWQVGSWMFDPPSQPSLHNAGFIVADIPAIADPHEYRQAMTCLANEIRQTPPATGVARVSLLLRPPKPKSVNVPAFRVGRYTLNDKS